jgi:tetratricopeptide (TPR) repeat protein
MDLQLTAAQAEIAAGSIDSASPFLKRAAASGADNYRLHAIRGEIAQLQDQDEVAINELNAALARLPQTPAEGPLYGIQLHMDLMNLYRNISDTVAAQHNLETAQSEIKALDGAGPGREQFLRLRALIKLNTGNPDSALNDIDEALATNPSSHDAQTTRSRTTRRFLPSIQIISSHLSQLDMRRGLQDTIKTLRVTFSTWRRLTRPCTFPISLSAICIQHKVISSRLRRLTVRVTP